MWRLLRSLFLIIVFIDVVILLKPTYAMLGGMVLGVAIYAIAFIYKLKLK